jgi:Protein of unknown function (DUF2797)
MHRIVSDATGQIRKLIGQFESPIQYFLPIGNDRIALNNLIGKKITLTYLHQIFCIQCNRKITKSFQQGFCYPCYRKLMACNLCIIYPEKCNYPQKDCPDTWEHAHCKQEHVVYLANSSGLKVGITRSTHIPTRWIDQGASQAILLFKVSNRYQSGLLEVSLKQYVSDKTNWRKMLGDNPTLYEMATEKEKLLQTAKESLAELFAQHQDIECLHEKSLTLTYPILEHPLKLSAITFDKEPEVTGRLLGIKGQYFLLDTGVINIRKHSGYAITLRY